MIPRIRNDRGTAGVAALVLLVSSVLAAGILSACASSQAAPSGGGPSTQAIVAAVSQTNAGGAASPSTADQVQTSSGGNVTIDVSWDGASDSGTLTFEVAMNTHSVGLDGYDLSKLAILRNDRGQEVKPERWDAPPGGHHRRGVLTFPAVDSSGKPVVDDGVKSLELMIKDVAGVSERVLKWEVS